MSLIDNIYENNLSDEVHEKFLICCDCFKDEGLRFDAFNIGFESEDHCPNCNSKDGKKLTKKLVLKLCQIFFVRGTIQKSEYGGCPLIQFNKEHFNNTEINFSHWLIEDIKLIEKICEIGFFFYGPRLWMVGENEPLLQLQNKMTRRSIIDKLLDAYPLKILTKNMSFYRLRKNPSEPENINEYDTAPSNFQGKYRFDQEDFPVLYGSPDLECCVHECRTTVEDNIFMAKLTPLNNLKMLDLTALLEEENDEFENLDTAIYFLFLAGDHSYKICRDIAIAAKEHGFDGILYPSYFSHIRTGTIPFETIYGISIRRIRQMKDYAQSQIMPNVAVFGRPIKENKLIVECINKVIINKVEYGLTFGPAFLVPKE